MKKLLLTLTILFIAVLHSQAVLKEKDLARTMNVLYLELSSKHAQQKENIARYEAMRAQQHEQLVSFMQECEQIGLILYSQNTDFTFDVAYACQEATDMHRKLHEKIMPYNVIRVYMIREIAKYDSLIYALKQLPPVIADDSNNKQYTKNDSLLMKIVKDKAETEPFILNAEQQKVRRKCLELAKVLRDNIKGVLKKMEKDNSYYTAVAANVERLNNYANERYSILQKSIFIDPGNNYFKILATLPRQITRMMGDIEHKYRPLGAERYSQWRGGVIIFCSVFMLVYIFLASIISSILIRWCLPKKLKSTVYSEGFRHKRPILIMAGAMLIFALVVMVLSMFMRNNLMSMATKLMIELAWMAEAIYVSLLIRLNNNQIKAGVKLYSPFILLSLIVIWFRIILIPNSLVNLIFPPILLAFTIWQVFILRKNDKKLPLSDKIYTNVSFAVMLASCIMGWIGFTLMAVQIIVWWMFQLAAIATITCLYDLMDIYEIKVLEKRIKKAYNNELSDGEMIYKMRKGYFINKTWAYDFFNRALVPIAAVASIVFSVFFASDIFEIRDLCVEWFTTEIINIPGAIRLSLVKVFSLAVCFFIFKYVEYLIRSSYNRYMRNRTDKAFNATLAKNIIAIIVWGTYIIACLFVLDVPRSGIEYVATGLSAGLGFASKDILENFVYGISLMTGRVRVGDYIECDGITGKVESITYQSTQIITLDGSVIAFLNSQLFSKNFKNLTRNHEYELVKIPFGVAYGSKVEDVRKMVIEGVSSLCKHTPDGRDIVNPKHPISIAFSDFGDNSVDLLLVVWVLVDQKISFTAQAKEKIYDVLNEHNIEIPFPQRDIYIRSIAKSE